MGAGQHQMTIALKEETASAYDVLEDIIVGNSDAICRVRDLIRQVARSDASVMLTGPSGSGKDIVATALHHESKRAHNRFIAVNCGADPRDLLDSELFGPVKVSFPGATAQRRHRFEETTRGT